MLVVDDSRTSADALSAYLQAGGMSVLTVYHGPNALRESKGLNPERSHTPTVSECRELLVFVRQPGHEYAP